MTFTDLFKSGLWQCMVCSSLTRDFLSTCDRSQFSQYNHHVCLCSFQVFTNLHRHCEGGGDWSPISYQYIDPIEQLNYCLVFCFLAILVSTTKVFLVRYRTNTHHHLPSDPKWCFLVVSSKSADHLGMSDTIVASPLNSKRLEQYLQTVLWSQHAGWHVGQFVGHHSPLCDKKGNLLQKT